MKNYTTKFKQHWNWFWTVTETYTDERELEITKTTDQSWNVNKITFNKEANRKLFQELWYPKNDYLEKYDEEWNTIATVKFEDWKLIIKNKEQIDKEIEEMIDSWYLED